MFRVSANCLLSEAPPKAAGWKRGGGRMRFSFTEETEGTKHRKLISKPRVSAQVLLFGLQLQKSKGRQLNYCEEMPLQPQLKKSVQEFLKSFIGVVRILQIILGAGLWITIASNKYEGFVHYVLFVAVFFWLLTLALFFLTLLNKQDLVPIVGGERWLLSNVIHDFVATLLYLSAVGIMIYKTDKNSFCDLEQYKYLCLYKVYLTGSVFAGMTAFAYLLSAIYGSCRKCRGEQTVV